MLAKPCTWGSSVGLDRSGISLLSHHVGQHEPPEHGVRDMVVLEPLVVDLPPVFALHLADAGSVVEHHAEQKQSRSIAWQRSKSGLLCHDDLTHKVGSVSDGYEVPGMR